MKAEGFNWYGESSEDDEDENQQAEVSKQEQAPSDFASLLKGETDKEEQKTRSIAEILGISKSEDNDSEPSTFDKIIGRTLEEEIEETAEVDSPQFTDNASEFDKKAAVEDNTELPIDIKDAEADNIRDEANAVKTLYDNTHEQPLADLSYSEPEASAENDNSGENRPDDIRFEPKHSETPGEYKPVSTDIEEVHETILEPEQEQADNTEIIKMANESTEEASAETAAPLSEPIPSASKNEAAPETSTVKNELEAEEFESGKENQFNAKESDNESAEEPSPSDLAEADRRLGEIMGEEGSEDEQPPPNKPLAKDNSEAEPPSGDGKAAEQLREENSPENNRESSAGMLALLLGVREIFKRRKGDKENRQAQIKGDKEIQEALDRQAASVEITKHEMQARQERAEEDIVKLNHENIGVSSSTESIETELNNHPTIPVSANLPNQPSGEAYSQPYDYSLETGNLDNFQSHVEHPHTPGPEYYDIGAESNVAHTLETNSHKNAQELKNLNPEIDGELAFENRQENTSNEDPSADLYSSPNLVGKQASHISDVISERTYFQESSSSEHLETRETGSWRSKFGNEEFRSSIKAGVTTGLIIVVLIALFLIFR